MDSDVLLGFKDGFVLEAFHFYKMLIDEMEPLWCFYQLFELSFWRHPFTAEDPFMIKWCNDKWLQICSNEETNVSAFVNDLRESIFSAKLHFRLNYSFKFDTNPFNRYISPLKYFLLSS